MLPPEEYERAAREADYHVQIAIQQVEFASDDATLQGTVVRVFRGPAALHGTIMRLSVNYFSPEQGNDWAPDGMGRLPVNALRTGHTLEAFIVQTDAGLIISEGLCTLIDAATERPQLE